MDGYGAREMKEVLNHLRMGFQIAILGETSRRIARDQRESRTAGPEGRDFCPEKKGKTGNGGLPRGGGGGRIG